MPPEFLNILIQVPMVGIVIWLYKQFMDFLREEREIRRADQKEERAFREREIDKIASTLVKSDETIASVLLEANKQLQVDIKRIIDYYIDAQVEQRDHDATMRLALVKMEERTRPRPVKKTEPNKT